MQKITFSIWYITHFPWSDLKISFAIRKSVSSLTNSDIFENIYCIFHCENEEAA